MGIVKMKRQFEFRSRGYSYGTDILYVYCDKCGSFSIKTYIGIRKRLLILAILGVIIIGFFTTSRPNLILCGGVIYSLVICITALMLLWREEEYQCRKCRNTQIVINHPKDYASEIYKYNTKNYPPDMELIDVPDHLTQKRYQGYWDDAYR